MKYSTGKVTFWYQFWRDFLKWHPPGLTYFVLLLVRVFQSQFHTGYLLIENSLEKFITKISKASCDLPWKFDCLTMHSVSGFSNVSWNCPQTSNLNFPPSKWKERSGFFCRMRKTNVLVTSLAFIRFFQVIYPVRSWRRTLANWEKLDWWIRNFAHGRIQI